MKKYQFNLLRKLLKYLYPYRKAWIFILVLNGVNALVSLVNPYLGKIAVDKAIADKDLRTLAILALVGGSIFLIGALADTFRNFLERYIKIRVGFDLNRKVYNKIQKFPLEWFQDKSTGEHIYKINFDVDRVNDFITTSIPRGFSLFPQLIFILIIVLRMNWKLAIFSFMLAPLLCLPSYYFTRKMRDIWQLLIENSQEIFKSLNEIFSHMYLVKSFGRESFAVRKYLGLLINNIRISTKNARIESVGSFVLQILNKLLVGIITVYGMYQVIKGEMTFGSFTAVMMYLGQLMGMQWQFTQFFQNTILGLVSCERLDKILSEEPRIIERDNAKEVIFRKSDVVFDQVSFGYQKDKDVIQGLSFNINNARHIALVGPSGCGKTTIFNLILRLYEPQSGRILIDGNDIRDIKLKSLRAQIGVALQEPFLWNDTIENNIRYAREDALIDDVMQVSRICGVDDFVSILPRGYQTVIGENACKISEGQKQKIAIARAVIKKPKILILDEATSSMDSASEERIIPRIKEFLPDTLLITASHRLSTVESADLVYYLASNQEIIIDIPKGLLETNCGFRELFMARG